MALRRNYAAVAMLNAQRAVSYRNLLQELGHEVQVVRDGEEAQQLFARQGLPQLLIVDASLAKVDGVSLVRQLRRETPRERTGVIVVSAHESMRAIARQYIDSLSISRVLPLDADRTVLREAILAAMPTGAAGSTKAASLHAEPMPTPAGERPEDVLDQAVVDALRRFHASMCVVYLKAGARERVAAHFSIVDPSAIECPDLMVLRQLATAGEPLIVPDTESHVLERGFPLGKFGSARGFAGVPLLFEHADASGTLCLLDTRPLTLGASDVDAVAGFTRDLARAIERRLEAPQPAASGTELTSDEFVALERLAVTDPLTGLANRRGGEQDIASEIARAKRQKTPLSCIMLDIDRFKEVNDTFGHQAGDHLLREISALLRRTVRAYDILVRWGGEEFLIVLPSVDLDQARRLAERVRRAVESLETQGVGPITVSAGAAMLDADYDFEAMLAQADRRLYQAKAAGRNCIA